MSQGRTLIAGSLLASVALIVTFLVLGGSSYTPAQVGDPCKTRQWRAPEGVQQDVEQFSLSALDGAACELHVSRETLVLALGSAEGRERFAQDPRLQSAVRAGLVRAIDDAERAGALNPLVANGLRVLARQAPVDDVIALIEDAKPVFERLGPLLEGARALLPDELQGLIP